MGGVKKLIEEIGGLDVPGLFGIGDEFFQRLDLAGQNALFGLNFDKAQIVDFEGRIKLIAKNFEIIEFQF